jgi:hypothetical protein
MDFKQHKNLITKNGFTVINSVFSEEEIESIREIIQDIDTSKETFRKSEDLLPSGSF